MQTQQFQDAMTEATRLTRTGRLADATALIQRTLGNPGAEGSTRHADDAVSGHSRRAAPGRPADGAVDSRAPIPPASVTLPHRGTRQRRVRVPRGLAEALGTAGLGTPGRGTAGMGTAGPGTAGRGTRTRRPAPPPIAVPEGARFLDRTFRNAAGSRGYKLYVPSGYGGEAVPLVVMLHGGTQTAADFAAGTRMNELAERDGFLVAYPEQPPSANQLRCWNWFQPADQRRDADRRRDTRDERARRDVEPEVVAGRHHGEGDPRRPGEPEEPERPAPHDQRHRDADDERVGGVQAGHRRVRFAANSIAALPWLRLLKLASVSSKPKSGNMRGGAVGSVT